MRRRLDAELVRRGLASSRTQAVETIARGAVLVRGAVADKAARMVDEGEPIFIVAEGPRFVSRGGHKLEAALDRFAVSVTGLTVLDVGASTGGFTDCLLQRGASDVIAVDVGIGQLHERLRADRRVEVHERCNVRTDALAVVLHGRRVPLIVGDLSFISLRAVAPSLFGAVTTNGSMVLLVKPQFEAGRADVTRGRGVVRDPEVWRRVLGEVSDAFRAGGAGMMAVMPSPITGADGNVEFLARFDVGRSTVGEAQVMIDAVVLEALSTHVPSLAVADEPEEQGDSA
jgi:23S rRNA (cytidine1920-2'-O)/16S rRNA (cytidine1409-2'-O)-methyltransferase